MTQYVAPIRDMQFALDAAALPGFAAFPFLLQCNKAGR